MKRAQGRQGKGHEIKFRFGPSVKTAKRSASDYAIHPHSLLSPAGPGGDDILALMNMEKT